MITEAKIKNLVEAYLKGKEIFLVDAVVKTGNHISVFIDGDHGVTIENCREINHFLSESLDRDTEDFDLTVSSAGADRPLKLARQYKKNIGKAMDVVTKTGDKITGVLQSVREDGFDLETTPVKKPKKELENKIISLYFNDIKSAKEVITFKQ